MESSAGEGMRTPGETIGTCCENANPEAMAIRMKINVFFMDMGFWGKITSAVSQIK